MAQTAASADMDLVVIGRNSLGTLTRIYGHPPYAAFILDFFQTCIYVDSHSTDGSLSYMEHLGFHCVPLAEGERPCASAGRAAGTRAATAPYVLFLDGDMALEDPEAFASGWPALRARLEQHPGLAGASGAVTDVYPGGGLRIRRFPTDPDGTVRAFGGAVLFHRDLLEAMGGWDPDILAQEELELHARLSAAGKRLMAWPAFKVRHHTWVTSPLSELLGAYFPVGGRPFGGAGMAARAAWQGGHFRAFAALLPEPFALLGLLALALPLLQVRPYAALALATAYAAWVAHRRSLAFNAVVPGYLLSLPWGWMRYRSTPHPSPRRSDP